jgi:recombination protein RecT
MTENTVSNAVAVRDNGPGALVEQYKSDLAMVMPSHVKPDTFVRLAVSVLRRDKNLALAAQNNPAALMGALMEAARLGLEPGTEQYYLTPRKVKGRMEVQGIRGYQGEIELIYRAGAVSSVIVEVVRAKDHFSYSPGRDERPTHEIDWDAEDRGPLRLVYAYAVMKDGATSKVVVLNRAKVMEAKALSQGSDSQYSPWQRHEEAMWLKTAAHRLTKWVPTSAEYMREQLRAHAEVAAEQRVSLSPVAPPMPQQPTTENADEVVDAEFVDDGEPVDDWTHAWNQLGQAAQQAGWNRDQTEQQFAAAHDGLEVGNATADQLRAFAASIRPAAA